MSGDGPVRELIKSITSLIKSDTKDFINLWVFITVPMLFMGLLMAGMYWLQDFANEKSNPSHTENCWTIKAINGEDSRFNTCTGEIKSIPKP